MAFFSRNATTAELRAELARLNAAAERTERRTAQLEQAQRHNATSDPETGASINSTEAIARGAADRVADLETRLEARLDAVAAQLTTLDARITSVSRELANQLSELGTDIDSLAARQADELDAEEVEELRDTQLRLANEQARYQFAFRRELAELADQLRRPPAR